MIAHIERKGQIGHFIFIIYEYIEGKGRWQMFVVVSFSVRAIENIVTFT